MLGAQVHPPDVVTSSHWRVLIHSVVVGLTGGIASGKSTVSHLLSSTHHLPIIDADYLARAVIEPGTSGYDLVVSHFGADRVLLHSADGGPSRALDRSAIGDIVFRDADERRWLNRVVHPRVRQAIVRDLLRYWLRGEWCVIVDVPLLVEAGLWYWVGEVVVVFVNERLQMSRLMARPPAGANKPLTPQQAAARIASQMPLAKKLEYATAVIDNSGPLPELDAQVDRLVAKWRAQQGGATGWWWRACWIPPVGLTAGALCLLARWWRWYSRAGRRRSRGEVRRRKEDTGGERIELTDMRRRAGSGATDDD